MSEEQSQSGESLASVDSIERTEKGCIGTCCGLTNFADDEARGYVLMGGARGFAILTGILYLTLAINTIASELKDECDKVDFGFFSTQATSVVALIGSVEAFITMTLSPVFGAVADLSDHRKTMYKVVQFIWAFMSVLHIVLLFIQPRTAALLLIFGVTVVFQTVFYELSYVLHFSFLPEIGRGNDHLVSELSSKYYVLLNAFQFLCVVLVSGPQFGLDIVLGEDNPLNPYVTAQYASALVVLTCGYYTIRSLRLIKSRKASKSLGDVIVGNTNPVVLGFRRVFKTITEIWVKYPQVLLFLLGFMLLMGTVSAVVSLSTVYFQSQLGFSASTISFVVLCSLVFTVPGSALGNVLKARVSVKKVMMGITALWIFAVGTAPLAMTGEPGPALNTTGIDNNTCADLEQVILGSRQPKSYELPLAFFYAMVWGIGIGASYPVAASFYSVIIPGGQEAEYFGARTFLLKVASLLPPAVFFAVNEATKRLEYAYMSLTPFIVLALISFSLINLSKAKSQVADTLHLRHVQRKSGVFLYDAEEGTLTTTKDEPGFRNSGTSL